MSTYYDLHCTTCDEYAGFHINHGDRQLGEIWAAREAMAGLERLFAAPMLDIDVRLLGDENNGMRTFPAFAAKHKDHDVRVRDEYGRYVTQCHEYAECPACGHRHNCTGNVGHEGPHTPPKRDAR